MHLDALDFLGDERGKTMVFSMFLFPWKRCGLSMFVLDSPDFFDVAAEIIRCAVKAMAISYNWLFQWNYTF